MEALRLATVAPVANSKAVAALFFSLLALVFLGAGIALPQIRSEIDALQALVVVPAALIAALIAVAMVRRARFDYQRSLGRLGGNRMAGVAAVLASTALLVSLAAVLALGVYGVLVLVQG